MGLMKKYSQFLKELPSKTVVFAFGRFNPPTIGHELLVKTVNKLAATNKADPVIYASKTQDAKKNPLSVDKKVHYLQLMFPNVKFVAANNTERTFIEAAKALNKKYKNLIMVAGSDRIAEYERILNTYNGKEFHFDTVQVVSAGERDPDSDDATGMSASKMRAMASKGDFSQFKKGLPSTMRDIDGRRLMNDVRQGMGLEVIKEHLNLVKDNLREQYFRGEIFNIGDIVESAGVQYEIVKRGSNHLLLKEESGKLVSKWIQDVTICEKQGNRDNHIYETKTVITKHKEEGQGEMNEELTDKTLKKQDKIKVARIIATMLGVENAESSGNPEQLVNTALRKVRTKTLTADTINILQQMLNLATEVGIQYDPTLKPQKLKEGVKQVSGDDSIPVSTDAPVVNTKSTYNMAKDRLRYKDFQKLNAASKGITEATVDRIKQAGYEDDHDATAVDQHDVDAQLDTSVDEPHLAVGHLMTNPYHKDDNLRRRKVKYHLGEESIQELSNELLARYKKKASEVASTADKAGDFKKGDKRYSGIIKATNKQFANDMKKYRKEERSMNETSDICSVCDNPEEKCECDSKDIVKNDSHQIGVNNARGFDAFFEEDELSHNNVDMSQYEHDYNENLDDEEISDDDIDDIVNSVDDVEDIIDVYDDEELAIVDDETGDEDEDEEHHVNEEALNEVLSRIERMRAKVRFKRTQGVRTRKMKIALRTSSSSNKINQRARRLAVKLMKKRMLRGRDPSKISVGEKERIERVIQKRKAIVGRLAMKLAPRVRSIEKARLSHKTFTKTPAPAVGM